MRAKKLLWIGALLLLCHVVIFAGPLKTGITVQAGTLGYGAELVKGILPGLNLRLGANFFNYGMESTYEEYDLAYDIDIGLQSYSALLNFYPFQRSFFLCSGVYINNNLIEANAMSTVSYTYGGLEFTPEELGELGISIGFAKVSPYFGIGFGNPVKEKKLIGLVLNIGALYHDSPDVTMTATGMIEPTAEQEPEVEADIEELRFFPVISLGLSVGF